MLLLWREEAEEPVTMLLIRVEDQVVALVQQQMDSIQVASIHSIVDKVGHKQEEEQQQP